jgi:hypothetical protein
MSQLRRIIFPILVGIVPSRFAFCASRINNFERFPIDEGMRPDKSVLYKISCAKFHHS